MTVTEYNESVAAIRRDAGLLLDVPSMVCAALTECRLPAEAVAKLPPILAGKTETRLRELVARAPCFRALKPWRYDRRGRPRAPPGAVAWRQG
jgi:hypothetical protein